MKRTQLTYKSLENSKRVRFTEKLDMKKANVNSNFERVKMLNEKYIASDLSQDIEESAALGFVYLKIYRSIKI